MGQITVKDKTFEVSINETTIKQRVREVAQQMSRDLEGKNPLFLAVLNGAFIFAADLMREMTIPCEISFVKLASYQAPSRRSSASMRIFRDERWSLWRISWKVD